MGCGQWWLANESHLPSCHSEAPPAASELEDEGTHSGEEKGAMPKEETGGGSNAKHIPSLA